MYPLPCGPLPPTPPLEVFTEYWAELPVPYSKSPPAICLHMVGCTDFVLCVTQGRSCPHFTAASQHLVAGMRTLDWAQQIPGTFRFLPLCSDWVNSIDFTDFFFFSIISSTVIPPICFFNFIFQFYSYTWVSFYFFRHCWNVLPLLSVSRVFAVTSKVVFWWVL